MAEHWAREERQRLLRPTRRLSPWFALTEMARLEPPVTRIGHRGGSIGGARPSALDTQRMPIRVRCAGFRAIRGDREHGSSR